MKKTEISSKRPVTFSFISLMGIIAGRTLGNMSEDIEVLARLTGRNIGSAQGVSQEYYAVAREKLIAQFPRRFKDFHLVSCIEELDKMMENPGDDKMRKMLIRGWLIRMAARTKMDMEAYYPVKKCRRKME